MRVRILDFPPTSDRFRLGWRRVDLGGVWSRPTEVAAALELLFSRDPDPDVPDELARPWVALCIDASGADIRSTAETPLATILARVVRSGQALVLLVGFADRVEERIRRCLLGMNCPELFAPVFLPSTRR
jgi:hypothetical protein